MIGRVTGLVLAAAFVVVCLAGLLGRDADAESSGSTEAPSVDTLVSRAATRAAYRARINAHAVRATPADEPATCPKGFVHWRRGDDVDFCTNTCTSDFECLPAERCRAVSATLGPQDPFHFADDATDQATTGLCDPFWDQETIVTPIPIIRQDTEADFGFTSEGGEDAGEVLE